MWIKLTRAIDPRNRVSEGIAMSKWSIKWLDPFLRNNWRQELYNNDIPNS
jgi:hypothetical protein